MGLEPSSSQIQVYPYINILGWYVYHATGDIVLETFHFLFQQYQHDGR